MSEGAGPVLIFYDGSPQSRHAIEEAGRLFPGARAVVLHVWSSLESTVAYRYSVAGLSGALKEAMNELEASGQKAAEAVAEEGAKVASKAGLEASAVAVEAREHAWATGVEELESRKASVGVVGSRGLGALRSMTLGGFSHGLVQQASRPVLVVPPPAGAT